MKKSYTQTGASSSGEKRNNPPGLCAYYPGGGAACAARKGVGMMQAFLKQHRWVILAAGAAIQVLTGVPAAWGVFQRGVCEGYSLSQENAAMIFSLTICFFGIGCILGGLLQDKKGPRTAGLAGAVLLAAGTAFCPDGRKHPGLWAALALLLAGLYMLLTFTPPGWGPFVNPLG